MQDVVVSALELRAMGGRTRALRASPQGSSGRTDDRGQYRLFGLQPGTYVVQAVAAMFSRRRADTCRCFTPALTAIDLATPTKLDVDAAAAGIDLALVPTANSSCAWNTGRPAGNPAGPVDVDVDP